MGGMIQVKMQFYSFGHSKKAKYITQCGIICAKNAEYFVSTTCHSTIDIKMV